MIKTLILQLELVTSGNRRIIIR